MNQVKNLLKDPKNFVIINATHDYYFKLRQNTINDSDYFIPSEVNQVLNLNELHINSPFKKLDSIVIPIKINQL